MAPNNTLFNDEPPARAHSIDCNSKANPCDSIQRCGSRVRLPLSNGFTLLEHRSQNDLRPMNVSLAQPDLQDLPLPNSETDPDSWSCSESRDTSPESSIPPGMPSFRVIPLTSESDASGCRDTHPSEQPNIMIGSEQPDWETEPLQQPESINATSTMLQKNQYWV